MKALRLLGSFFSAQILIQLLSLTSGFIIVRCLSKQDYATYALANSFAGSMSVLCDIGVGAAALSLAGRLWPEKKEISSAISAALKIRRKLYFFAVSIVIPVLCFFLYKHDASPATIAMICLLMIITTWVQLSSGIYSIIPKLFSEYRFVQRTELASASVKSFSLLVFFFVVSPVSALFANLAEAIIKLFKYKNFALSRIPVANSILPDHRAYIRERVLQQAFPSIYYCFSSQITILLVASFGHTSAVAEVAALGRFAIIFVMLQSFVQVVLAPEVSKLKNIEQVKRKYFQWTGSFTCVCIIMCLFVWAFGDLLLLLLGPNYAGLNNELSIAFAGSSVAALAGLLNTLNKARGWVSYSWISIPTSMIWIIVWANFIDMSRLQGAVVFGALMPIPSILISLTRFFYQIRNPNNDS